MITGKRLKELREACGMTQDELAIKVGYQSRSSINKLETDPTREIPTRKMKLFADALNVSVQYLMGWEEEEPDKIATLMSDVSNIDLVIKYNQLSNESKQTILNMINLLIKKENV